MILSSWTAASSFYQVTNELKQHATLFEHGESEYSYKTSRRCSSPFFTKHHRPVAAPGALRNGNGPGLVSVGADGSA